MRCAYLMALIYICGLVLGCDSPDVSKEPATTHPVQPEAPATQPEEIPQVPPRV